MRSWVLLVFFASFCALPASLPPNWQPSSRWLFDALEANFFDHAGALTHAAQLMTPLAEKTQDEDAYRYAYSLNMDVLDLDHAEKLARAWLRHYPKSSEPRWALLRILLSQNRIEPAFLQMLQIFKVDAGPHNTAMLSRYLSDLNDADQRLRLLTRLAQAFPKNPFLYYYLGMMAREQGHLDEAIRAFQHAIALDGKWVELRLMQARTLSEVGEVQKAETLLRALFRDNPDNHNIFSTYVRILAANYRFQSAEKLVRQWLKKHPHDVKSRLSLPYLESNAGALARALQSERELLDARLIPRDQYFFDAAQMLAQKGHWQASDALLREVPSGSVLYLRARQRLGLNAFEAQQPEEAARRFAVLRARLPDYALESYLVELAALDRFKLWRTGDALLKEALARYPHHSDLLYAQARHESAQGQNEAAMKTYRQLLKIDPANTDALNAYGYLLLSNGQRYKEASEMIRAAWKAYPDAPAIQDSYAWLNFHEGRIPEALTWSRRAYAAYRQGLIVPHYVEILLRSGQKHLAREVFESERRGNPQNANLKALAARFPGVL